jgi:hypothetical protein
VNPEGDIGREVKRRENITPQMNKYLDYEEGIKKLQKMVDEVCEKIKSGKLTLGEARKEAALVRLKAEKLIPFEMDKFDLIYAPRLRRMIEQFLLPKLKDDLPK